MLTLTPLTIALFVVSALIIGIAKTSVGGIASLAVAAFAWVMPTKESTAAVLLLLIVGDIVAVRTYRRDADWSLLRKLLPSVLPGIALGALFMLLVDDTVLRRSIGGLLVIMFGIQVVLRLRRPGVQADGKPHPAASIGAGVAAGFTTMTANSAGGVMTLYLLAARVDKRSFVGTNAWFFLLVNLSKVPFSAALGLFPPSTLLLTLGLLPVVLVGTLIGRRFIHRLTQGQFDALVLTASAVSATLLLVR